MAYISFLVSFVCFLIAALAGLFEWDTSDFDGVSWGLVALALGHFLGGGVAYVRSRVQ